MDERTALAAKLVDHELSAGGVAALGDVYEKTFAQLAPVIGAKGVRGIFARALERVRREHPELQALVLRDEPDAVASQLAPCLANATRDAARAVAVALYTAFFDLIVAFVGRELTARLLQVAWPELRTTTFSVGLPRAPPKR
jgi:hypothetical protein